MEWATDGHFEEHPSMVFLNRRLAVPEFKATHKGKNLTIETSALRLRYRPNGDGKFSPTNLTITLTDFRTGGEPVVWYPGLVDTGNLQGTTRTLDGARGDKIKEPIEPGLLSRNGWTLVDDSARPLFDSDDFTFAQGNEALGRGLFRGPQGIDWTGISSATATVTSKLSQTMFA